MRRAVVAGNWKMHGTRASVQTLLDGIIQGASQLNGVELIVFPPAVYIPEVASKLAGSTVAWGGQNLSANEMGAFTGEIAAEMLTDYGCRYVLVGHSERRTLYHEDNIQVAMKFAHAKVKGLTPIFCIGETLEQREQGLTEKVLEEQINAVLALEDGVQLFLDSLVAYEPVWAIGTGLTASPEQAQAVHAHIRQFIASHDAEVAERLPILYGGSVKPQNAQALFAMPDIDGGLIGGASLDATAFLEIAECIR